MSLDPTRVPPAARPLLSLAGQWNIGDDFEREQAVNRATDLELRALVDAVDAVPDEELYEWLAGDESHSERPSAEYLAVTVITMAADSARHRLRRS